MTRSEEKKTEIANKRIDIIRDSLKSVVMELNEAKYFSIDGNSDAQEYFNYKTLDDNLAGIKEQVLALNHQENGNPLVPYGKVNDDKALINKVSILNHRWLIAEFFIGDLRGEVLVKYFYSEGKPTDFETIETVLYNNK
ncbi:MULTISPECIES: hydrolase [Myroides]|nr:MULTISPECIES: hydrolase [Myroides]UVD79753.1 hydrolase [Myroides albus]